MKGERELREEILALTKDYYNVKYGQKEEYKEGERVNYSGRVFDEKEMMNLVDSSLDFWLTAGRYADEFEKKMAEYQGLKYCSLVNSGSSANLLAFMALTSTKLGERRICKGDEVISVAAGFPTTIAPIIQYGAVPVFLDITVPEYNINVEKLEEAYTEKTKAVFLAHTLGNPFPLDIIRKFCDKHNLWLIEDNCDALGSEYLIDGQWKKTGTVGDIGTSSFYPPHHITMGEGGCVYTDNLLLHRIVNSFRDWGRDCWCKPGQDGSCKHRYEQKFGELPFGYDHKYVYSHFGYNLKATDMQASIGCAQMDKLDDFTKKRRENWDKIRVGLEECSDVLLLPREDNKTRPSWFGYILAVKEDAGFTRDELTDYLESHNIQTRCLFAGNILRQPCFDEYRDKKECYRVVGELTNTDFAMNQAFWIGVYPGMEDKQITYMVETIKKFVRENSKDLS